MSKKSIKVKISEALLALGKTATSIAEETGINRNTINSLINDKSTGIQYETLNKLITKYDFKLSDFFEIEDSVIEEEEDEVLYKQEGEVVPVTMYPFSSLTARPDSKFGKLRGFMKNNYGYFYWDKKQITIYARELYNELNGSEKLDLKYREYLLAADSLEHIYMSRNKLFLMSDTKSLQNLFQTIGNYFDKFWDTSLFIDCFDAGEDRSLIEKIMKIYNLSPSEVEVLSTPAELTFNQERDLELMNLIDKYFKLKRNRSYENFKETMQAELTSFVYEYDYSRSNYAKVIPVDDDYLREFSEQYIHDPNLFEEDFKRLNSYTEQKLKDQEKIIKDKRLKQNPLKFFELITYWREHRKKVNLMGMYVVHKILDYVSSHVGIKRIYLNYMVPSELNGVISGLTNQEVLKSRYEEGVAMIVDKKDGFRLFEGAEARSIFEEAKLKAMGDNQYNSKVLYGQTASQGYAKGTARVIKSLEDFDKFNEGEVLITSMTRPEFVPLMKKASAIVTDEGGVTCHAAIVSRELGKPCIIGTHIATEKIQDGDLVEVRANHATVRVLV